MKKFLAILAMFIVFAVTIPVSVSAYPGGKNYRHNQNRKSYQRNQRQSNRRYYNNSGRFNRNYVRRDNYRYERDQRSVYSRHRNLINIGIGGAAGAIIGGIIGGKRGALIGAGVGAGSGAAYTYGINPKKNRNRYNRRRN